MYIVQTKKMNFRYIIIILTALFSVNAASQTVEQARKLFSDGEYKKAKPAFKRFVKSQPSNANYNYWYGVCCLMTNDAKEAIAPLQLATKRKVPSAPYYLGEAYDRLYCFEEAVDAYQDHIDALVKKKQPTEEILLLQEKSKQKARMLKGVEEVCIIDSFMVEKATFLEHYKISEESGKLYAYGEYFNTNDSVGTVYETELGNKIYYSEFGADSTQNILTRNKLLDGWSKGSILPGSINKEKNANYPFVSTDGITIYYASDGEGSIGGYDIFVTRYNTSTDGYLNPENVGMPFNSPYNDYMYVIDEYNELGWFATDRHQIEDKVCIYVFIPNATKQTYNYEAMDQEQIRKLAQIHSIKESWKNKEEVAAARERLEAAIQQKPQEKVEYDFSFVINDALTYHDLDDFKSPQAKELFKKLQQKEKDYRQQRDKLNEQRKWFSQASVENKAKSSLSLLDLENRVLEMYHELKEIEVKTRNTEINHIKK